jgi:cytochrome c oxidase assembly protein subunit 11
MDEAQRAAYAHYASPQKNQSSLWWRRFFQRKKKQPAAASPMDPRERNLRLAWYMAAVAIGALGASYAAVPLYKVFCQTTGFGGTTQRVILNRNDEVVRVGTVQYQIQRAIDQLKYWVGLSDSPSVRVIETHTADDDVEQRLKTLRPVENAELVTIRFDSTVTDTLPWSFVPVNTDVRVVPGETALAFFRVTNHSDHPITGVAVYNVHPAAVGRYFSKIQCFCFEEQRLRARETVDMPVFFYLDPDMLKDPQTAYVKSVTLSYTFFPTDQEDEEDDDEDDDE